MADTRKYFNEHVHFSITAVYNVLHITTILYPLLKFPKFKVALNSKDRFLLKFCTYMWPHGEGDPGKPLGFWTITQQHFSENIVTPQGVCYLCDWDICCTIRVYSRPIIVWLYVFIVGQINYFLFQHKKESLVFKVNNIFATRSDRPVRPGRSMFSLKPVRETSFRIKYVDWRSGDNLLWSRCLLIAAIEHEWWQARKSKLRGSSLSWRWIS